MSERELTADEKKVLTFLYKARNGDNEIPAQDIIEGTGLSAEAAKKALRSLREIGYIGGSAADLLANSMKALKEMDPDFEPTKRGYAEHIILMASAISQADESFLARELAYDPEFVGLVGSRLRNAGIWKGDAVAPFHLDQWKVEGIAFFMSGAVATGDLMIVGEIKEEPQYKMTDGGKRNVEKLLKR